MPKPHSPRIDPKRIDEHILGLPLPIPRESSVAAAIPPEAWVAIAEALEPIGKDIVDTILSRFSAAPPAPIPAPGLPAA